MTRNRHRLTRASTERMLDGIARGRSPIGHPVGELLVSAVPRPTDRETASERRALAAFRATRDAAAGSTAPARPRVVRLATLKVTAAAVVLAAGAVAVGAATTDMRQSGTGTTSQAALHDRGGRVPVPQPVVTAAPGPRGGTSGSDDQHSSSPGSSAGPGSGSASPPAASTAPAAGSCADYRRLAPGQRKKALLTAEFAELVRLAGGVDKVDRYCHVPNNEHLRTPGVASSHGLGTGPAASLMGHAGPASRG